MKISGVVFTFVSRALGGDGLIHEKCIGQFGDNTMRTISWIETEMRYPAVNLFPHDDMINRDAQGLIPKGLASAYVLDKGR